MRKWWSKTIRSDRASTHDAVIAECNLQVTGSKGDWRWEVDKDEFTNNYSTAHGYTHSRKAAMIIAEETAKLFSKLKK